MTLAVSTCDATLVVSYILLDILATLIGISLSSQVMYLRLNPRTVKPFSSSPNSNSQSCCSSTEGGSFVAANLSCIVERYNYENFYKKELTWKVVSPSSVTHPMTTSEFGICPLGESPKPTQPVVSTRTAKEMVSFSLSKFQ